MQKIPHVNSLRKSLFVYRSIRHRKGHGIHSPFVFHLITKVIEERCPYYCFQEIERLREQLLFRDDVVHCPDSRQPEQLRRRTIGDIVKREAISAKNGRLLFRLTNHFKPRHILQIGTSVGLSTLYLTAYAPGLQCIALENASAFTPIARIAFGEMARTPIDLREGAYQEVLPQALQDLEKMDFVFFNLLHASQNHNELFNACVKRAQEETIFVFEGIKANRKMRALWKTVCAHPSVTVTVDLYAMGIVFFNPTLYKRNYMVYF